MTFFMSFSNKMKTFHLVLSQNDKTKQVLYLHFRFLGEGSIQLKTGVFQPWGKLPSYCLSFFFIGTNRHLVKMWASFFFFANTIKQGAKPASPHFPLLLYSVLSLPIGNRTQRVTLSLETALAGLNCVFSAFQIEEVFSNLHGLPEVLGGRSEKINSYSLLSSLFGKVKNWG